MQIRIDLQIADLQMAHNALARASLKTLFRVDPRKRWTETEYKEHIRFHVQQIVDKICDQTNEEKQK